MQYAELPNTFNECITRVAIVIRGKGKRIVFKIYSAWVNELKVGVRIHWLVTGR